MTCLQEMDAKSIHIMCSSFIHGNGRKLVKIWMFESDFKAETWEIKKQNP